ncbi:MAG: type I-E CRISPR-associated protein Cas7/Cse4/CasC [Flavobacteriales bacterium]
MSKNYINFHILISHSPSCLNRDDMNMQKSAVFGGARRVRISSQSLKRAMRKSDYYAAKVGKASDRTRELGMIKEKYIEALKDRFSTDQVIQAIEWISGKDGLAEDTRADAVAPWAVEEVSHFCQVIADAGEDADKQKLEKQIIKNASPFKAALAQTVDIALSGRMATSGLMTQVGVDGALAVAHAITTHAVDADIDWFTAVDDLISDEGEVGAGHLNTQEFSSGVFYRYASLNLKQLQVNLGLLADMQTEETADSRKSALEIARHVLHLMATVVPSAKQQSFAAHNLADYALVSFSDMPVSLANAFERPVTSKEGFLAASVEKLNDYWKAVHQGYGLDEQVGLFQLGSQDALTDTKPFDSLSKLESWIEADAGDSRA